jgi:histidinol-phosphate/aromatic aminotransferase/cobyric acid decarboxylase-like protein
MFMMNVKRSGQDFFNDMAAQKVMIGRVWKACPNWVRVSVGTREEMAKFKEACLKCYTA